MRNPKPEIVVEAKAAPRKRLIVNLGADHPNGTPIYVVPGIGGHVISFKLLGNCLSPKWNLFGLLHPIHAKEQHDTVEEVATRLCSELRTQQPRGPYYLIGHSMGALIALEIAKQLRVDGEQAMIVILDSRAVKDAPRKPLYLRLPYIAYWKTRLFVRHLTDRRKKRQHDWIVATRIGAQSVNMPKGISEAVLAGRKQLERYEIAESDVPAILIKSQQIVWWDALDYWPEDWGWSKYVDLKTIKYSPGDHLNMVKSVENVAKLAPIMETAIEEMTRRNYRSAHLTENARHNCQSEFGNEYGNGKDPRLPRQ